MEWTCVACGSRWPTTYAFCATCGAARASTDSGTVEVDQVLRALVGDQLRDQLIAEGGRLPEQRRLVTSIFADLSGFTNLAGRLDPEALTEVVDPILAGLVRIVQRGEGHVGSFAGDALLAFFGAPVAHEDDAQRAVRCATRMLAEFPALRDAAGPDAQSLSLRIGVDTGAVMARLVAGDIRTDYNILGNAVNMAQRLQSNAPMGGCVVGETTYRLALEDFEFEDLGGLQVKGRDEPLPAFLLLRERARPVLRRAAPTVDILGRVDELAEVETMLAPGPARGLVLQGEAGVGKSRLLEEARRRSPLVWHEGGCVAHDTTSSYRPWIGALAEVADDALPGLRLLRGEERDPALLRMPPAARRDLVAQDVARALRAIAPTVVVLEDLHWADQPSLDLLDDLLHGLGETDVAVLVTSREPVTTTAAVPQLSLSPLPTSAVAGLVAELLDGAPPDVLVEDITHRSGGNPLYVAELAGALRDRGLVSRVEGGALVATSSDLEAALDLVPDSLEGLVASRIDALPTAEQRVLTMAAVLGAPVEQEQVTALAIQLALPHAEVPGALAGLAGAGMLAGTGFVHAVVQHTAYVHTPRARRRTLHLAAAEACRDLVPASERAGFLARHLYLGGAGPRAVDALETAAADAIKRGAHEEAVLHLRREVELRRGESSEQHQRVELPARLTSLGDELELLGRYLEAEVVLREAVGLGARGSAERVLTGCLRRLGRYDDAVALAEEVLATSTDPEVRERISEEKGWSLAAQGRLDEAVAALEPTGSPLGLARGGLLRSYCLMQQGETAAAYDLSLECVAVLRERDRLELAARGLRLAGEAAGRAGRLDDGERALTDGLALARASGAAEEVAGCLTNLVRVAAGRHDLVAAVEHSRESVVQADRMRHTFGRAMSRNNLAFALVESGRFEESVDVASEAVRIADAASLTLAEGSARHTRGSARLALGDAAGAAVDAARSVELLAGTEDEQDSRDLLALALDAAGPAGL